MTKPETLATESDTQPFQPRERKPWVAPVVIVATDAARTEHGAAGGSDGPSQIS